MPTPGVWSQWSGPLTKISDVAPGGLPQGNGQVTVISAWNSAAFDTIRRQLYVYGGGHGDWAGTEVYAFKMASQQVERWVDPSYAFPVGVGDPGGTVVSDLGNTAQTFKVTPIGTITNQQVGNAPISTIVFLSGVNQNLRRIVTASNPSTGFITLSAPFPAIPSPGDRWAHDGVEVNVDGTPASVHTYGSLIYADATDRFYTFGGIPWGTGALGRRVGAMNPNVRTVPATWSLKPDMPGSSLAGVMTAYDAARKVIWWKAPDTRLWRFNLTGNTFGITADTWSGPHSVGGGTETADAGDGRNMVYDADAKKLVIVGGFSVPGVNQVPGSGYVAYYDVSGVGPTYTFQQVTTTGVAQSVLDNYWPGLLYDPIEKKIALWVGGKTIYYLDTTTWSWTTVVGTGVTLPTISPAGPQYNGTFGHFAYAPAPDDKYILIVADPSTGVDSAPFIYTPARSPLNIPDRTWVARGPISGPPVGWGSGGKHMHCAAGPANNKVYNCGGDWNDTLGGGSGQQQMYSYDILANTWQREITDSCGAAGVYPGHPDQVVWAWDSTRSRFTFLPGFSNLLEYQEGCGLDIAAVRNNGGLIEVETVNVNDFVTGDIIGFSNQNGVGATFDGNNWVGGINTQQSAQGRTITVITNKRFTLNGSTYVAPDGTISGGRTSNRRARVQRAMTWDPITRLWTDQAPAPPPHEELRGNHGMYDPVNDRIVRSSGADGGSGNSNGITFQFVNPTTWTTQDFNFTVSTNGINIAADTTGTEYMGLDPTNDAAGRRAYAIDPIRGHLHVFHLDTHTLMTYNTPLNTNDGDPGNIQFDNAYAIYDTNNRVLLWPYVRTFSTGNRFATTGNGSIDLRIFHPELVSGTGINQPQAWETDPLTQAVGNPPGLFVRGNAWCFHAALNCLVGWGGHAVAGNDVDNQYVWLYRYAAGGAPPPPPPVARRVASLTVSQGA